MRFFLGFGIFLAGFFGVVSGAAAQSVSASLSPSGDVYPGTYLQLSGSVSGAGYSGPNCWYLSVNGGSSFCWVGAGSGESVAPFGWVAGSADPNTTYTISLCTSTGVCSSAGSVRVVPQPAPLSVSASLSPSGDVYPGTYLQLSGSVSGGSGYTGSNCWFLSINGSSPFCWVGAGSGIGSQSFSWNAGSADPSTSYSFSLCTATGVCSGAGSLRVVNPNYTLSVSTSGSGSVLCNGSSCALSYPSGTSVALSASPSSGYQFSGWGGACSGTGSCSLTMDGNKSVTASFVFTPVYYTLSLFKAYGGSVSGGGISCGDGCSEATGSFQDGTSVTLTATPSSGFDVSAGDWSGCDSAFTNQGGQALCNVRMNAGRSVSISFRQRTASASFISPAEGTAVNYQGGTYFQWSSSNTTGCSISSLPSLAGYPKTGLPSSHSGLSYWSGGLKDNVSFTLNCTPVSGVAGSPSAEVSMIVNPPPSGTCTVSVTNTINHTFTTQGPESPQAAWRLTATGSASNCPSSYFTNLSVSGNASSDRPPSAVRVFDKNKYGGAFFLGSACPYLETLQIAGGKALRNSGTRAKPCTGGGTSLEATGALHFQTSLSNLLSKTVQGLNIGYTNDDGARQGTDHELFAHDFLPWGNYPFHISNAITGTYLCPDGTLLTINTGATVRVCVVEPEDSDGQYFDSQCTPQNPSTHVQVLSCPGAPNVGITIKPTCSNCPPPPPPAPSPHLLSVQSKLDGASKPGVDIVEVSVSDPDPTYDFPPNYFAGTTDYTRLAERNVTVVLEAPATHPQGGFLDQATPWTGDCAPVASNPRQCSISFAFSVLGGQKKIAIANYTSTLEAPVITTSPASCDATGGKAHITIQSAVAGATGYKLYRRDAASSFSLIKTFTSSNAPVAGTPNAPFLDSGMAAGTPYFYKMEAYNASTASSASAEASRTASLPCPDLIVEPGSVEIIESATGAIISPAAVPANTAIKFRAKIRNQNGDTPTLPSPGFYSQFTIGTTELTPNPSLPSLGKGMLASVSSGIWLTPTPTTATNYSLQVCTDIPVKTAQNPANFGVIVEKAPNIDAELNNCLPTAFSFSVVNPITVELECQKAGGTWDKNYCVIDYTNTSNLRWTVTGNPSSCTASTNTDWTGTKANQSYTITGNPLSLANLLNKLIFKYQLECTR